MNAIVIAMFNLEEDEEIDEESNLAKIGIDSTNLLINISSYLLIFFAVAVIILFMLLLYVIKKRFPM